MGPGNMTVYEEDSIIGFFGFSIPTTEFEFKNLFGPYLVTFSLFWALKTHFRIGRHVKKEKRLFYFCLRILLQSKFSSRKLKIQKIQKSTSPSMYL
jgi:hypothetical protein